MLTTPSIQLTDDQKVFLDTLRVKTDNLHNFHDLIKQIVANGGSRDIYRNEKGVPTLYLRRHYLYRGAEREAMIHQFFLGDKGPLHDHPAESWGMILQTGYNERLCTYIASTGRTEGEYDLSRNAGDWSQRPASNENHDNFDAFHKVKLRDPRDAGNIFTFFVMEKRNSNSWGFRDNDGKFVNFDAMNKSEKVDMVQSSPDDYGFGWFPNRIK